MTKSDGAAETVRTACRRRCSLDGADAQALENALTITERERDAALRLSERERGDAQQLRGKVRRQRRELRRLNGLLREYAGVLRNRSSALESAARTRNDMNKYRERAQAAELALSRK